MRTEAQAIAALLGVFALHNAEETLHLPVDLAQLAEATQWDLAWLDRRAFGAATGLLTVLAGAGGVIGQKRRESALGEALSVAVASALLGNGLTHAARALVSRSYNGGLATAPLMAAVAVRVLHQTRGPLTRRQRQAVHIAANAMVSPLILAALTLARTLTTHQTREPTS